MTKMEKFCSMMQGSRDLYVLLIKKKRKRKEKRPLCFATIANQFVQRKSSLIIKSN